MKEKKVKARKTTVMINGQTIDLLESLKAEYELATGVSIVNNDLLRRVLSKSKVKDLL